ncbi:MAG: S8 family serine peptidase [Actinomycetota bacterium]
MTNSFAIERPRATRALAAFVAALALTMASMPAVQALGRLIPVIVEAGNAQQAADLTKGVHGTVDNYLPIVDAVEARVPSSRIAELSMRALVVPDRAMHLQGNSYGAGLVSAYPAEVGATSLWGGSTAGAGVTVALVDTGIADVPDLADHVVARANFTKEKTFLDTYGHGTFEAGIVAGDGTSSGGRYVGVAPDASLMSVKVADSSGATSLGQVLAGIQLVDFSAQRFNVRVLLLPLDSDSPFPPELDPLSRALRTVWAHGVVVVVPAGNDGPTAGTIASPGNDPVLLTAGSVNDMATPSVGDDQISTFSSRGPTAFGEDKPDVVAPGEHIVSLRAPGSTIDRQNPSAVVEGSYFKGSGTSMSAAVTAGAAALLLSARPDLNPDHVKALLMATATPVVDGDASSTGAGVVNASEAASFSGDLPALHPLPDMGDVMEPFSPPGLDFGWRQQDGQGAYYWVARQWAARSWDARSWSDDEFAARQWAARSWAARSWDARQWDARSWDFMAWQARQWAARSWDARSWAARQWTARAWDARAWDARNWDAQDWLARQWTARQWDGASWDGITWDARAWDARAWDGRSWDARAWDARAWDARAWDSRSWDGRSWDGRTWDSRSWDSRSWDSRTWDSRSWDSRTWDSRTWDSRTWDSRAWDGRAWDDVSWT